MFAFWIFSIISHHYSTNISSSQLQYAHHNRLDIYASLSNPPSPFRGFPSNSSTVSHSVSQQASGLLALSVCKIENVKTHCRCCQNLCEDFRMIKARKLKMEGKNRKENSTTADKNRCTILLCALAQRKYVCYARSHSSLVPIFFAHLVLFYKLQILYRTSAVFLCKKREQASVVCF